MIFESLKPKCEIHVGIIDLWSRKLNEEERHKNPNSISRLFCNTGVLTAKMVKQPLGDFSLFNVFKQEMDRILKTYNEQINEFDMLVKTNPNYYVERNVYRIFVKHEAPECINDDAYIWKKRNDGTLTCFIGTRVLKPMGAGHDAQLEDLRNRVILAGRLKDNVIQVIRSSNRIMAITVIIEGEAVNVISAYAPQVRHGLINKLSCNLGVVLLGGNVLRKGFRLGQVRSEVFVEELERGWRFGPPSGRGLLELIGL
ncbi:hypothetical protein Tco_0753349 [Tanacetum coccineum]